MRKFLYGLIIGTGLGYAFHENIDRALRRGLDKANEKAAETGDEYVGKVEYRGMQHQSDFDAILPTNRWRELHNATSDKPVTLTSEDIAAMGPGSVQTGINSGVFKLPEESP